MSFLDTILTAITGKTASTDGNPLGNALHSLLAQTASCKGSGINFLKEALAMFSRPGSEWAII